MKKLIYTLLIGMIILKPYTGFSQENSYFLGQAAYEQKDYAKASNYFEKHLQLFPKHDQTSLQKAKCDIELKEYDNVLTRLANLKPSTGNETILLKARAFAGKGNYQEALKMLDIYKNLTNKLAEQVIISYPEFMNLKHLAEWDKLWSSWKYSEKENELNNIRYAIKTEKFGEAADRLDGFLMKFKSNDEAYFLRGNIYIQQNDYQNALLFYENAVKLDNKNSEYLMARASALNKSNKKKKALEEYNLIIQNDSLIITAYLGRAIVYSDLEDYSKALTDIGKFRKYYPQHVEAIFVEAKANAKIGDYLSAIGEFGKLIKLHPETPEYFIGRADAYSQTKTYTYAIKDYSMALDLDPKNIEVYKKKANALRLMGDMNGACIDWGHAARLGDIESMNMIRKFCKNYPQE